MASSHLLVLGYLVLRSSYLSLKAFPDPMSSSGPVIPV